jgi:sugar lactone lactonase YvrE
MPDGVDSVEVAVATSGYSSVPKATFKFAPGQVIPLRLRGNTGVVDYPDLHSSFFGFPGLYSIGKPARYVYYKEVNRGPYYGIETVAEGNTINDAPSMKKPENFSNVPIADARTSVFRGDNPNNIQSILTSNPARSYISISWDAPAGSKYRINGSGPSIYKQIVIDGEGSKDYYGGTINFTSTSKPKAFIAAVIGSGGWACGVPVSFGRGEIAGGGGGLAWGASFTYDSNSIGFSVGKKGYKYDEDNRASSGRPSQIGDGSNYVIAAGGKANLKKGIYDDKSDLGHGGSYDVGSNIKKYTYGGGSGGNGSGGGGGGAGGYSGNGGNGPGINDYNNTNASPEKCGAGGGGQGRYRNIAGRGGGTNFRFSTFNPHYTGYYSTTLRLDPYNQGVKGSNSNWQTQGVKEYHGRAGLGFIQSHTSNPAFFLYNNNVEDATTFGGGGGTKHSAERGGNGTGVDGNISGANDPDAEPQNGAAFLGWHENRWSVSTLVTNLKNIDGLMSGGSGGSVGVSYSLSDYAGIYGVTGSGVVITYSGEKNNGVVDGTVRNASFAYPNNIANDYAEATYYVSDLQSIRRINHVASTVTTLDFNTLVNRASTVRFNSPRGMCVNSDGHLLVCDQGNDRIRKVITRGISNIVSTLAGSGEGLLNSTLLLSKFNNPNAIAINSRNGKIYIADTGNNCIRVIDGGNVTTCAGNGTGGHVNGPGLSAAFFNPMDIALSSDGNKLYICDTGNQVIREYDIVTNMVSTLVGTPGQSGSQDGYANVTFSSPTAISVVNDKIYVADTLSDSIRMVTIQSKLVETISLNGLLVTQPTDITEDTNGDLYISDSGNNRIIYTNPLRGISYVFKTIQNPMKLHLHSRNTLYVTSGDSIYGMPVRNLTVDFIANP